MRGDDTTYNLTLHHLVLFNCGGNGVQIKGDHNKLWATTMFNSTHGLFIGTGVNKDGTRMNQHSMFLNTDYTSLTEWHQHGLAPISQLVGFWGGHGQCKQESNWGKPPPRGPPALQVHPLCRLAAGRHGRCTPPIHRPSSSPVAHGRGRVPELGRGRRACRPVLGPGLHLHARVRELKGRGDVAYRRSDAAFRCGRNAPAEARCAVCAFLPPTLRRNCSNCICMVVLILSTGATLPESDRHQPYLLSE